MKIKGVLTTWISCNTKGLKRVSEIPVEVKQPCELLEFAKAQLNEISSIKVCGIRYKHDGMKFYATIEKI